MRIAFLIRSLDVGGTERQLVNLATGLRRRGHSVSVLVFYTGGAFTDALTRGDVPVIGLSKRGRWDIWGFTRSLRAAVKSLGPDVLYSLLPAPNLFSIVARTLGRNRPRLVWGVRSAGMDLSHYEAINRVIYGAERRLAFLPDRIVANSIAAQTAWRSVRAIDVIPNGIDIDRFNIDLVARDRVRAELGLPASAFLIMNVGRLDPIKDHGTFIRAAAIVSRAHAHVHFAVAGSGNPQYTLQLKTLASDLGIESRMHWLGTRRDTAGLYNASDLFVSSSSSEAFPNVVAEAMACGLRCVVTDAGDSRYIVSDEGAVVRHSDPENLAAAIMHRMDEKLATPQEQRDRIVSRFSVDAMLDRTEALLEQVIGRS